MIEVNYLSCSLYTMHAYLACDLGAESGRVMLGLLNGNQLSLQELHRFSNAPARVFNSLRWDLVRIFEELKVGLKKAADRNLHIKSLSVDSWGVDYVYFNSVEPQLGMPFHYRDARTDATYQMALTQKEHIFSETGIQFMSLNTLYQFIDDVQARPELLALADQFLNVADYLNYLFSGVARADQSLASTTQVYNPRTRAWSKELMAQFGFSERLFPQIVPPGTRLGPLIEAVQKQTGLGPVEVVATCSHDTGAAVAAVPAEGGNWAYLSSGTWSLIGLELPAPLINEQVLAQNFTNEAGYGGTTRFLKNISGLFLLQECRRFWLEQGTTYSYAELNDLAAQAEPLRSLINPAADAFAKPDNMPGKIAAFCKANNETVPQTVGQFTRCILESLALCYGETIEAMEQLTGNKVDVLHIVGGGSQSKLLNQFAADSLGRKVVAGPVEATAIGNVLVQAIAMGQLKDLAELRTVVRTSFPVESYEPKADWQSARERFRRLA